MFDDYQPGVLAMKLHIVSDLHTEFADFTPPDTDADVVVLAGDVGVGTAGVEWAARRFRAIPVLYVPGNHEYYDHDLRNVDDLRAAAPDHIHVLDKEVLELGGVRFLGATLWTDFRLHGEGEAWFARQRPGEHHRAVPAGVVDSRTHARASRLRDVHYPGNLQSARISRRAYRLLRRAGRRGMRRVTVLASFLIHLKAWSLKMSWHRPQLSRISR